MNMTLEMWTVLSLQVRELKKIIRDVHPILITKWYDSSYICAPYQRYHIISFGRSLKCVDLPHRLGLYSTNEWINQWMNEWMNEVHWFNKAFGLIDFWDEVCISDSCCEAQLIIPGCNYSTTTHVSILWMSFRGICTTSYYHHNGAFDKGMAEIVPKM